MSGRIWGFHQALIMGSLVCIVCSPQAIAQQDQLTSAEVYRLQNSVQLLLRNQSPRPARLSDVLRPLDALRTARTAIAELLFNEGSIARVDQNTTFRFETGMRRFQLPNRIAMNETIFVLENGTALIMSPPNSVGTQVRTPDSVINIVATDAIAMLPSSTSRVATKSSTHPRISPSLSQFAQTADLLPPPDHSSAVMVTYDADRGITQVFALTDGDITVADSVGRETVALRGGQTVAVARGEVGTPQEFDLQAFYRSVSLAAGLGPGQEAVVAQQPEAVQLTLTEVREATLAAIQTQARRLEGFTSTFLQDALSGSEGDFEGLRNQPSVTIINPQVTLGTFIRTGDNTAVFIDNNQNQTPITVDFDDRTITIGRQTGVSSSAGLSGNNASGTVVFRNGRVIRLDVFNVNGDEPAVNVPFRGSITTGIEPDR